MYITCRAWEIAHLTGFPSVFRASRSNFIAIIGQVAVQGELTTLIGGPMLKTKKYPDTPRLYSGMLTNIACLVANNKELSG